MLWQSVAHGKRDENQQQTHRRTPTVAHVLKDQPGCVVVVHVMIRNGPALRRWGQDKSCECVSVCICDAMRVNLMRDGR